MSNTLVYLVLTIFAVFTAYSKDNYGVIEYSESEYTLVIYHELTNCQSCYLALEKNLSIVFDEYDEDDFAIIGLVNVRRKRDIKGFVNNTGWEYPAYKDDNIIRKKFNLKQNVFLVLLNRQGKLLYQATKDDLNKMYPKMLKALKKDN